MDDKLELLYNTYVENGLISSETTFGKFSEADQNTIESLYQIGVDNKVVSPNTNIETFSSAFSKEEETPEPTQTFSTFNNIEHNEILNKEIDKVNNQAPNFGVTSGTPDSAFTGPGIFLARTDSATAESSYMQPKREEAIERRKKEDKRISAIETAAGVEVNWEDFGAWATENPVAFESIIKTGGLNLNDVDDLPKDLRKKWFDYSKEQNEYADGPLKVKIDDLSSQITKVEEENQFDDYDQLIQKSDDLSSLLGVLVNEENGEVSFQNETIKSIFNLSDQISSLDNEISLFEKENTQTIRTSLGIVPETVLKQGADTKYYYGLVDKRNNLYSNYEDLLDTDEHKAYQELTNTWGQLDEFEKKLKESGYFNLLDEYDNITGEYNTIKNKYSLKEDKAFYNAWGGSFGRNIKMAYHKNSIFGLGRAFDVARGTDAYLISDEAYNQYLDSYGGKGEFASGFLGLLLDLPFFAGWGKVGSTSGRAVLSSSKARTLYSTMFKGTIDRMALRSPNVKRNILERGLSININKTLIPLNTVATSFAGYEFQRDILNQAVQLKNRYGDNIGSVIDDINYFHSLKEGSLGYITGASIYLGGRLGKSIGNKFGRPGVGEFAGEFAAFAHVPALLEKRMPTSEDYGMALAYLIGLKGIAKIPEAYVKITSAEPFSVKLTNKEVKTLEQSGFLGALFESGATLPKIRAELRKKGLETIYNTSLENMQLAFANWNRLPIERKKALFDILLNRKSIESLGNPRIPVTIKNKILSLFGYRPKTVFSAPEKIIINTNKGVVVSSESFSKDEAGNEILLESKEYTNPEQAKTEIETLKGTYDSQGSGNKITIERREVNLDGTPAPSYKINNKDVTREQVLENIKDNNFINEVETGVSKVEIVNDQPTQDLLESKLPKPEKTPEQELAEKRIEGNLLPQQYIENPNYYNVKNQIERGDIKNYNVENKTAAVGGELLVDPSQAIKLSSNYYTSRSEFDKLSQSAKEYNEDGSHKQDKENFLLSLPDGAVIELFGLTRANYELLKKSIKEKGYDTKLAQEVGEMDLNFGDAIPIFRLMGDAESGIINEGQHRLAALTELKSEGFEVGVPVATQYLEVSGNENTNSNPERYKIWTKKQISDWETISKQKVYDKIITQPSITQSRKFLGIQYKKPKPPSLKDLGLKARDKRITIKVTERVELKRKLKELQKVSDLSKKEGREEVLNFVKETLNLFPERTINSKYVNRLLSLIKTSKSPKDIKNIVNKVNKLLDDVNHAEKVELVNEIKKISNPKGYIKNQAGAFVGQNKSLSVDGIGFLKDVTRAIKEKDTEKIKQEALNILEEVRGLHEIPENLMDRLMALSFHDITLPETPLEYVKERLDFLNRFIKTAKEQRKESEKEQRKEWKKDIDLMLRDIEGGIEKKGKRKTGGFKLSNIVPGLRGVYERQNENLYTLLEFLDTDPANKTFEGNLVTLVREKIQEGRNIFIARKKRGTDLIRKISKETIDNKRDKLSNKRFVIEYAGGKPDFNSAQLMSLYAFTKNKQNDLYLIRDGIIKERNEEGEAILTKEGDRIINEILTPGQKEFVDRMIVEFFPSFREEINNTSMEMFKIPATFQEGYSGKVTLTGEEKEQNKKPEDIPFNFLNPTSDVLKTVFSKSLIDRVPQAKKVLSPDDFILNSVSYLNDMSRFIAYGPTGFYLQNTILSDKVKNALIKRYPETRNKIFNTIIRKKGLKGEKVVEGKKTDGAEMINLLTFHFQTIFNTPEPLDGYIAGLMSARRYFLTSVLAFNWHPGIKQLTSAAGYASYMGAGKWLKNFGTMLATPKKTVSQLKDLISRSPILQDRFANFNINEELYLELEKDLTGLKRNLSKWRNNAFFLTKYGDMGGFMFGGIPYYNYLINVEKLSPEKALKKVEFVGEMTQQSGASEFLGAMQKGPYSFFTTLLNSPLALARNFNVHSNNFKTGKGSQRQALKGMVMFWFVLPQLFTVAGSLIKYAFTPEDERDELWDSVIGNHLLTTATGAYAFYPIVGDLITYFYQQFFGQQFNFEIDPVTGTLSKSVKGGAEFIKAILNLDEYTTDEFMGNFFDMIRPLPLPTTVIERTYNRFFKPKKDDRKEQETKEQKQKK